MNLVFAGDEGYAMPMAVSMYSALENYMGYDKVNICIIDGGLENTSKGKLRAIASRMGASLSFQQPSLALLKKFPTRVHFSYANYLRLLIPDLLRDTANRIIYLDSDVLVLGDLSQVWRTPMGSKAAAAVVDQYCPSFQAATNIQHTMFGIGNGTPYLNSGLLMMNLTEWDSQSVTQRATDFLLRYPDQVRFADQDGINVALAGDWYKLDPKWNQLVLPLKQGMSESVDLTGVLHFASGSKPWLPAGVHYTNVYYESYLYKSQWYSRRAYIRHAARLWPKKAYIATMRLFS